MSRLLVISITSGRLFPSLHGCHNIFELRERKSGLLLCDRLELHFLELSKVDGKKSVSALTEIERLGAYLKFASVENRQDYVKWKKSKVCEYAGTALLLAIKVVIHKSVKYGRPPGI